VCLVQNINVSAGLVNSVTGTVVKVIYNNAEVQMLIDGNHPPPYCIAVEFPTFHGFVDKRQGSQRIFPFANQRLWVQIYKRRFSVNVKQLPTIDMDAEEAAGKGLLSSTVPSEPGHANNITAYRAQGQMTSASLVSMDLDLESPDKRQPPEIGSLTYVACSRAETLQNLFVSSIFRTLWPNIGKNVIWTIIAGMWS